MAAMGTVSNLNRFRKDKARSAKRNQADENAVKFGRSKAQKTLNKAQSDKANRDLDEKKTE